MMKTPKNGKNKPSGKNKKQDDTDIFSATSPQAKRSLEGSYPTGNASPNKTKSPVDNMKETKQFSFATYIDHL